MFDDSLLTLKKASLEEVKLKNKSKLKEKAGHIKAMAEKLMKMSYSVILIVPATSIQRNEVFSQFEEILQEVLEELPFPQFKMLNFPELMYCYYSTFHYFGLFYLLFCPFGMISDNSFLFLAGQPEVSSRVMRNT